MVKTTPTLRVDAKDLRQLKNLCRLSAAQLDRLAGSLTVTTFKKNEIIFDQDEQARHVYLLVSGVVKVSYNSYERQTIVSLLRRENFSASTRSCPSRATLSGATPSSPQP